jgi:hypothetical protein
MSYAYLFGVIVGMLIALGMSLLTWLGLWKRGRQQTDERTALIQTQAAATAFYVTVGFAFLGWTYQIVEGYLTGAEPPVVTPWSVMLGAIFFIWLGASLYQKWRYSIWTDLDEQERIQLRRKAALLLMCTGTSGTSARLAFEHGQGALGWFLIAVLLVGVGGGLSLLVVATRKTSRS